MKLIKYPLLASSSLIMRNCRSAPPALKEGIKNDIFIVWYVMMEWITGFASALLTHATQRFLSSQLGIFGSETVSVFSCRSIGASALGVKTKPLPESRLMLAVCVQFYSDGTWLVWSKRDLSQEHSLQEKGRRPSPGHQIRELNRLSPEIDLELEAHQMEQLEEQSLDHVQQTFIRIGYYFLDKCSIFEH